MWLVVPLCLLFVGMLWWARIRNHEPLPPADATTPVAVTPPGPATPAVPAVVPEAPPVQEVVIVPEPEPAIQIPEIPLSGFEISPGIQEYAEHGPLGAPSMIQLATALEAAGQFQRALLAWERVLDSMNAADDQRATACQAIKRLRPTLPDWNADPKSSLPLVIHVSTHTSHKEALTPILNELPKVLATASSAIVTLKVNAEFAKTGRPDPAVPAAVAIWFSRAATDEQTSPVTAFTPHSGEPLRDQLLSAIFKALAGQIAKSGAPLIAPRATASAEATAAASLGELVTRAQWQSFASSLATPGSD